MKIKKFLILALLIILITPGCSITKRFNGGYNYLYYYLPY